MPDARGIADNIHDPVQAGWLRKPDPFAQSRFLDQGLGRPQRLQLLDRSGRRVEAMTWTPGTRDAILRLNLAAFEHHQPAYLAINPLGFVPTLIDEGTVIAESMVINEYLDDRYPDPPLRPAGAADRARMRQWTKLADEFGPIAVVPHVWSRLRSATDPLASRTLEGILGAIPLWERRERWRKVAHEGFSAADREQARTAALLILLRMEHALCSGPWLLGEPFTLADIDLLPFVDLCEKFYPDLLNADTSPAIDAWLYRMRRRPAVAATYRPSAETCEPDLMCGPNTASEPKP